MVHVGLPRWHAPLAVMLALERRLLPSPTAMFEAGRRK
jgi:hypothetical protein